MTNKYDYEFLFLTCGARSGAALLSSILNANSKISFSVDKIKFFAFVKQRFPEPNRNNIGQLLKEMKLRLKIRYDINFDINICKTLINSDFSHKNIYKAIMITIYKMDINSKFLGECENMSWEHIPFFLNEIDNSKAISIIRDPRDVLYSFKENTIAKGNDYLVNIFNTKGLMQHSIKYIQQYKEKFYIIKYEHLKKNQTYEIKQLCDFIGVNFEENMLNEKNWKELGLNGWQKWRNKKVSSFYGKNSNDNPVNRWRGKIDPVDHFLVEWILEEEMVALGYKNEFNFSNIDIIREGLTRLSSSKFICELFYSFLRKKQGSSALPLDKYNPYFWDTKYINNKDKLNELAKLMGY